MDTLEHTELGNALRISDLQYNPYIRVDAQGTLHVRLQRFGSNNIPECMELELSAGQIIAMAGDYFTEKGWVLELLLPKCERFESSVAIGKSLIKNRIKTTEEDAFIKAYNNLASDKVTSRKIDRIYAINEAHYSKSHTMNAYIQQIMLMLRVKNYGEMLVRNQTHFTPWSVKVYVLGHTIALRYARLAYDLKQLAQNSFYVSANPDLQYLQEHFFNRGEKSSSESLTELAYRYEAQAIGVELFTFHYYSDHFAAGHMSVVGILRVALQERFGTWGSILANNLHDEINRIGLFTNRPYDPTPDPKDPATPSRGDGAFDTCLNRFNHAECIAGMTSSLNDITRVLQGEPIPKNKQFGGLEHMPDVDFNSRQHQPLLVIHDNKIYYRTNLSIIHIISPSQYDALRENPEAYGYTELTSKWEAFKLVAKLRLSPKKYSGVVQPVTQEQMDDIRADEALRNPQRIPIADPTCTPEPQPTVLDWRQRTPVSTAAGLREQGLFASKNVASHKGKEEEECSDLILC